MEIYLGPCLMRRDRSHDSICFVLRGGSAIIVIVNPPKGRKPEVGGSGGTIVESPNEMYKLSNVV